MKIGIVFGGISVEHEISVITGLQVYESMKNTHDVINIYFGKDGNFYIGDVLNDINNFKNLDNIVNKATKVSFKKDNADVYLKSDKLFSKPVKVDLAFLTLHGATGEDGSIQGFFDVIGLPYTGSEHYGSAIGQDKVYTKDVLSANNVSVLPYKYVYDKATIEEIKSTISEFNYPLIIKPAMLGSSVGINICKTEDKLEELLSDSFTYSSKLIIEECISGFREVNCAILGNYENQIISELEDVTNEEEFLSFDSKYLSDSKSKGMAVSGRQIPAEVTSEEKETIHQMCLQAFKALNLSGVVRFDLMIHMGNIYITEVNTIPGSLAFYLFTPLGMKREELYQKIIDLAITKIRIKNSKVKSYETNVLNVKNLNGKKNGK